MYLPITLKAFVLMSMSLMCCVRICLSSWRGWRRRF